MYGKPFGSIFGAQFEPKNLDIQKIAEKAAVPGDSNKVESPKKEPEAKTQAFQNTVPQFQATVDRKPTNPKLDLEMAKFTKEQKNLAHQLNRQDLDALNFRIDAAKLYKKVLTDFMALSPADKDKIANWITSNEKSLNNIATAKKLQQDATKKIVKNAELDIKIDHLENILKLKKEGIKVQGTPDLKYYRPTQAHLRTDPPASRLLPKIDSKVPMDQMYTINQLSAGLGDDKEDKESYKRYFYRVKDSLPSPSDYGRKQQEAWAASDINKKVEKNIVLAKELSWQSNIIDKDKQAKLKEYDELKKQITNLVAYINSSDSKNIKITTALGVLTETNPKVFLTGNLLESLQASLQNASQLGDAQDINTTNSSEILVAQASVNSQVAQQNLLSKENVLAQLQSQITGIPVPTTQQQLPEKPKTDIYQTIKNLLPWVVVIVILIKIAG